MAQLYRVGNPIDREERANLNLTLDDIQSRFSLLQSQVNFLSGGADVESLIQEIRQAIIDAEQATENVDQAIALVDSKVIELEDEIAKAENLRGVGEWNSTTPYKRNNIVGYDGNSYMALVDNTNVPTTDTNTWMLSSSKGDTGKGLTIKGTLSNPSQLPSSGEDGDAYYIGTNLFVWMVDHWEDIGQIKGDPGSDANVTTANIESALGYTPADEESLNNFKTQYEFATPTVVGRQLQVYKPDTSSRIPIFLSVDIASGSEITVSVDNGATSYPLKNVDGSDVTKIEKGFIEIIKTGSFFTLRNLKGGIKQSDLDELIRLVNEADVNDSTIRDSFITKLNTLITQPLSADSTWNQILLALNDIPTDVVRYKYLEIQSSTSGKTFKNASNSDATSNYLDINVGSIGFTPSRITIIRQNKSSRSTITWSTDTIFYSSATSFANCVVGANDSYRVPYVSTGNFSVPVDNANTLYEVRIYS